MFSIRNVAALVGMISAVGAWSQGTGPTFTKPTTGDLACANGPTATDTLAAPDETSGFYTGFHSLFDGNTFKGWWQDCQTGHTPSEARTTGAIFRVAAAQHAIYSTQRNGNVGGIILTNKIQKHYELMFDIWPSFGDDGGVFNRVTLAGQCFQTVLDYIQDGAYGGTWGEGGYLQRDLRPFQFGTRAMDVKIPGAGGASWTDFTKALNPTSFGCPASGCTQTDWDNLWDFNGWNTTRVKFWGGLTSANPMVHMQSWFLSKTTPRHWVPLWVDSLTLAAGQMSQWPANPSGFQVHGSGRFGGANGNWYKNIYIRYLDEVTGAPATGPATPSTEHNPGDDPVTSLREHGINQKVFNAPDGLMGTATLPHEVRVCDSKGRLLERFTGNAGPFHYAFGSASRGILFIEMKTAKGEQVFRVNHL